MQGCWVLRIQRKIPQLLFSRAQVSHNLWRGLPYSHAAYFEWRNKEEPGSLKIAAADRICKILERGEWGPEAMQALEVSNISFDTQIVSKALRRTKSTVKAMGLFEWLTANGFTHDQKTYGALANVFGEAGNVRKMKQVIKEMHKAGHKIGPSLYGNVIFWCACAGDRRGAIRAWHEMKQKNILPGRSAYSTMLDVFSREKRPKDVAALFLEIINQGACPSSRTYAILIRDLLNAGKLAHAYLVFRKLPSVNAVPQMQTFAYLMYAFAKVGNLKIVKKLGTEMRTLYDRPGLMFCNAVQYLHREGMVEEALFLSEHVWPELDESERLARIAKVGKPLRSEKFQDEEEKSIFWGADLAEDDSPGAREQALLKIARGLKSWEASRWMALEQMNITWDADTVNMMLRHIKKVDVAWKFFGWVKPRLGWRHDIYSLLTMLRLLAQNGWLDALEELLEEMQKQGVKLSIITFNMILKEFALAKNSYAAVRVFGLIKNFSYLKPNGDTFSVLISALATDKQHEKAFRLWERLKGKGCRHDTDMYNVLIHSLGSAGQTDKASLVFDYMLSSGCTPDVYTYTAILQAHSIANNTDRALQLYGEMMKAKISPIASTQKAMAGILHQIGKLEVALKLDIEAKYPLPVSNKEALMPIYDIFCKSFE